MRRAVVLLALLAAGCGSTKTLTVTKTIAKVRTQTITASGASGPSAHVIPRVVGALRMDAVAYGELVPLDAAVESGAVLGGEPPEIVITFDRSYGERRPYHESAVAVWRRAARGSDWRRIFLLRAFGEDNDLRLDDTGDVTGDGRHDVLLFQDQDGSGGCGVWRLLADARGRVRQLWARRGCADDAAVTIENGRLLSYQGVVKDPKSGTYVHCCWSVWRRTARRWAGTVPLPSEARLVPPPPPSVHHY
jgi:hypothetical protein